ncbi:MAG: hypothetical protein JSW61_09275 [Candidatus Thorarchaeota archaeon]|nr:MAG: hypothetical protein JSW61_09275 [Candidatus Thorarchaeota archaeon]
MKPATKIAVIASSLTLLFLLSFSSFVVTTDAASVLENSERMKVEVGDAFYIDAWGAGSSRDNVEDSRVLTEIHLEFEVSMRGERGVVFNLISGSFVANYSHYILAEGVGAAGRPGQGRFNGTITFVFRFNLTGSLGETVQITLLGGVKRTENRGPVLVMAGSVALDGIDYRLWQMGRIHRLQE